MVIGIICEGHSDRAVIDNLVSSIINDCEIRAIRPELDLDATDMAVRDPNTFGGWTSVKEECQKREKIDEFFSLEGQSYIIIHLDSAECEEYPVTRPEKNNHYCAELRGALVAKIDEWLGDCDLNQIIHAVAIEETDAWVLTIYDESEDSSKFPNPKRRLNHILAKDKINSTVNFDNYNELTSFFSKPKKIQKNRYLERNCSLQMFYDEVKLKVGDVNI